MSRARRRYKRAAAMVLAVAVPAGAGAGSPPVWGAEKTVKTDETMYVNLDCYGQASAVNVVKGCSLNGIYSFTDYGNYLGVENMSSMDAPVIQGDQVQWNLSGDQTGRFYYKCAMDPASVELPWIFDVSYKRNGVPVNADELAGASGLVEIHIQAQPNERARIYYRDNMLLTVAVPVDMSECYSVEAEGSQTQSIGDTTAVVFTALPGEEGDYKIRIGTDSFETTGVVFAMFPGTVEDLEHIKDLKEAKDTWQDAGDTLYDSLEQMAKSVEDMRDGVQMAQSGTAAAERARQTWSGAKDGILSGNDQAIASLSALSAQVEAMVPHLETAKETAEVIHSSMNDVVTTLGEMQEPLRKLHTRLRGIKSGASSAAENLPELEREMEALLALDARLQANEQLILSGVSGLQTALADLEADYEEERKEERQESRIPSAGGSDSRSESAAETIPDTDSQTENGDAESKDTEAEDTEAGNTVGGESSAEAGDSAGGGSSAEAGDSADGESSAEAGGSAGGESSAEAGGRAKSGTAADAEESGAPEAGGGAEGSDAPEAGADPADSQTPADNVSSDASSSQQGDSLSSSATLSRAQEARYLSEPKAHRIRKEVPMVTAPEDGSSYSMAEVAELLQQKMEALEAVAGRSRSLARSMSNLLDDTADAAEYSQDLVDNLDFLIEDLTALNDSLDMYYPDMQEALDDSARLAEGTAQALNSGVSLMTILQNTLRDSSEDMDQAARDSLAAGMELLDKSLGILDSTEAMRRAGRIMKDVADQELNKFDTENRFLFMDPSAPKESFTSDKNPEPNTIQIVLRTDEISLEDEEEKPSDVETAAETQGPLARMWNVLVKMWQAITNIFKER